MNPLARYQNDTLIKMIYLLSLLCLFSRQDQSRIYYTTYFCVVLSYFGNSTFEKKANLAFPFYRFGFYMKIYVSSPLFWSAQNQDLFLWTQHLRIVNNIWNSSRLSRCFQCTMCRRQSFCNTCAHSIDKKTNLKTLKKSKDKSIFYAPMGVGGCKKCS